MSSNLVRVPLVIGAVISGVLLMLSLVALITSNPRWDDHLINAVGVFAGAVCVSVVLRIAANAFRPQPGTSKRKRLVYIIWFVALVLFIVIAVQIALFIDNMSFL
jgi:chromate transport protein ChrA